MACTIKVNGTAHGFDIATPLLRVLRDVLGRTGTNFGCGRIRMLVSQSWRCAFGLAATVLIFIFSSGAIADDRVSFATGGYVAGLRSKEVLNNIDTDGDGTISKAEWSAFQEKVFTSLDVHKRGSLSASIFVSRRCARLVSFATGGFARGLCSMETSRDIDTNGDGRISHDEFMIYQGKIFDTMDTSRTHPGFLEDTQMFSTGGANRH